MTASHAILKGFANNKGLFVPENFEKISKDDFDRMCGCDYAERAAVILHKFFGEFDFDFLLSACAEVYSGYENDDPAPIVAVNPNEFFLELHHGKTCSNKDLSIGILPRLISESLKKRKLPEEYSAICLDSPDTCKAAMNSFKDLPGVKLFCFCNEDDLTGIQKIQLKTSHGANVYVAELTGDNRKPLDVLKNTVKNMPNTVVADGTNIACVAAQTAYYFSAYCDLINCGAVNYGDKVNFVLPVESGTELISCLYAKNMGLPVDKIIFSAEENNGVYELISEGKFKDFSGNNFERILYEFTCRNGESVNKYLTEAGSGATVKVEGTKFISRGFCHFAHTFEDIVYSIGYYFDEYCYLLDRRSAAAISGKADYFGDEVEDGIFVNIATVSPYKYAEDLFLALFEGGYDSIFDAICDIADEAVADLPVAITELENLPDEKVDEIFADEFERKIKELILVK